MNQAVRQQQSGHKSGLEVPRFGEATGGVRGRLLRQTETFTPNQASHADDIEEHAKAEGERTAEAAGD